jgi:hypothetical protein
MVSALTPQVRPPTETKIGPQGPGQLGCVRASADDPPLEYFRQELDDFILLMRSLSISYEQDRTAFSSEYRVKYLGPMPTLGS